jgi:hypothetical protein
MKHWIIAWLCLLVVSVSAQELVIVVNPGNGASSISKAEAKRIFLGKMKSWNGVQMMPIQYPGGDKLLAEITGKSLTEFKKHWVEMQIKGKGSAPLVQANVTALKSMVVSIPGAIAIIPKADADAMVKVLALK